MKEMGLHEIRREFLDFFAGKEHKVLPSFSLVPKDDKSLLLIGAGMAPLKKYFTGEELPVAKRVATCQKCIRTGDIENVGVTARHGTFFEMLGNFSFGDYFKKEAITWSWEFLTENLGLDPDKLWVTIYLDDDEAEEIWKNEVGLPSERIIRLGKEDNFWELEVGPSGPCSEIHYDRGEAYGCKEASCQPGCDCDRYLEIWNLVFTQFDKDSHGNYSPLPNPNIDTGMGLERIAALLEGVDSIFEIEAIRDILNSVEKLSNKKYSNNENQDISMRIITDHARAVTFMVSDGILPSNEGRGYVLRRLIRRASRHGKLLGIEEIFLGKVVAEVIDSWQVEYRELAENKEEIISIIEKEERKFEETIDQGLNILEDYIEAMAEKNTDTLDGNSAFKLYDTFGFPLDLTKEILTERKLKVDEPGFNKAMEEQRNRARSARNKDNFGWSSKEALELYEGLDTSFTGYEENYSESNIILLVKNDEKTDRLKKGDQAVLVTSKTPFYAEGGGQLGDRGYIEGPNGIFIVEDTQLTDNKVIIHRGKVLEGEIELEDNVKLSIDVDYRNKIRKNHTSTHLLHRALKDVLGENVNQAGSVVEDNRLRFDFSYNDSISSEELAEIEAIVNNKIYEALDVETHVTNLKDAKENGVVGLFEDSYGDEVRVLSIGDYSKELCGGTHVFNTSQIGIFKILSESSVASGVRRIEAITGLAVYNYLNSLEKDLSQIQDLIKANKNNMIDKLESLVETNHKQEKEIQKLESKFAGSIVDDIIDEAETVGKTTLISKKIDNMDMNGLRDLSDKLKDKLDSYLIGLTAVKGDKIFFVVTASDDLVKTGVHSGKLIKEIAGIAGGSGGGRPDMAQAGGKDSSKAEEAMTFANNLFKESL